MFTAPPVTTPPVAMVGFNIFEVAAKEQKPVDVWPENYRCYHFFNRIGTRWMQGMGGPTGLNWPAIYPLMDRLKLSHEDWDDLLYCMEVMESEALACMHEKSQ